MAPDKGEMLARNLAARLEAAFVDSWGEGPHVALMRSTDDAGCVALRSISEPAEMSIAGLRRDAGVAASVTALGYVGPSRRRARITVAVTCCSATCILRFTDGGVAQSDGADGLLVDVLRSWSGLDSCWCSSLDVP